MGSTLKVIQPGLNTGCFASGFVRIVMFIVKPETERTVGARVWKRWLLYLNRYRENGRWQQNDVNWNIIPEFIKTLLVMLQTYWYYRFVMLKACRYSSLDEVVTNNCWSYYRMIEQWVWVCSLKKEKDNLINTAFQQLKKVIAFKME